MKTTIKSAILALALAVTVSASASSYQFNNNLMMGSKGADVVALQDWLKSTGYFNFPTSTGYYGSVTKNAVAAFQAAKGISPAVGYFGPLTRSTVNSMSVVNPGTPTNPTTPTTPVVLNGQEGFAEYRLAPSPVNNTNIQTSVDVPVYGVEVKAKNADISVERLTLDATVFNTTSSSNENPATLINSITVKDGSTVLATIPVNTTTFSKYTASSTYYVQISGLSTRVAKDTIKTFTVYFNTNGIDTSRNVTLNVSANGVRVVDGRGISTYNGQEITSRVHTFKKAGNSTLTVKGDATTIYSSNNRINALSNGSERVLTSTFAVKSESGPSKLTTVTAQVATSTGGTFPTNAYLFQGSTLLDSRTVPANGTVVFNIDNSNVNVAQDTTSTFTVRVDMPATTAQGSMVMTTVTGVVFEKADGSTSTLTGLTVAGPFHFFATVVPNFTKVSSTLKATVAGGTTTGSTTVLTADFALNLVANGGDINVATTSATIVLKNTSTGATSSPKTVFGSTDSGITNYTDGSSRVVRFAPIWTNSELPATGNYQAIIQSVKYATSTTATPFTLPGGFEFFDTNGETIIK